jgi:TRAP-type mannitol/chloroaromatic compound transport system substrate-binding protein
MTRAELIEKLKESRTWTPDNWAQMSLESAHLMMDAAQMLSRSDYSSNSAIQQLEQEAVNLPKFLKDLLLRAVDELRVSHAAWREAEREIVSLERTVMRVEHQYDVILAQRDLARREVCAHRAACIQDKKPEDIADALQWDCFKQETR